MHACRKNNINSSVFVIIMKQGKTTIHVTPHNTLFSPHRAHARTRTHSDAALFYERLLATALFLDVVDAKDGFAFFFFFFFFFLFFFFEKEEHENDDDDDDENVVCFSDERHHEKREQGKRGGGGGRENVR